MILLIYVVYEISLKVLCVESFTDPLCCTTLYPYAITVDLFILFELGSQCQVVRLHTQFE